MAVTEETRHVCEASVREHVATQDAPYRYVGSGLPNVFLTGIKYYVCKICGMQSADIPALKELLKSLGRTVVEKRSPLTGEEVRFLRKRLGLRSGDFATMVGCTPVHFSNIETGKTPPGKPLDRLIRVIYGMMAGDKKLAEAMKNFGQWITDIHGDDKEERIIAAHVKNNHWVIQSELSAA